VFDTKHTFTNQDEDIGPLFDAQARQSASLREISISGDCKGSQQAISCLLERQWPELQVLALDDVSLERPITQQQTAGHLDKFLASHPTLRELRMPVVEDREPNALLDFQLLPTDLPCLTSFRGVSRTGFICSHSHLPIQ
jgi:hypothetical protein